MTSVIDKPVAVMKGKRFQAAFEYYKSSHKYCWVYDYEHGRMIIGDARYIFVCKADADESIKLDTPFISYYIPTDDSIKVNSRSTLLMYADGKAVIETPLKNGEKHVTAIPSIGTVDTDVTEKVHDMLNFYHREKFNTPKADTDRTFMTGFTVDALLLFAEFSGAEDIRIGHSFSDGGLSITTDNEDCYLIFHSYSIGKILDDVGRYFPELKNCINDF